MRTVSLYCSPENLNITHPPSSIPHSPIKKMTKLNSQEWILKRPIAHRGLHEGNLIPENSMKSFENAINNNYPVELDIQLLADNNLAVFHDDVLSRMTGYAGMISQKTYSEIKPLKLLQTDQHIPTLDEVLDLVNQRVPILIEIKNKQKDVGKLESILYEKIKNYNGEYAIQSFNPFSLGWFKQNASHITRGQLSGDFKNEELAWHKKFLLSKLLLNSVSSPAFIAYDIRCLPNLVTNLAKMMGLPIIAWTVSEENYEKAIKVADNYIFDKIRP